MAGEVLDLCRLRWADGTGRPPLNCDRVRGHEGDHYDAQVGMHWVGKLGGFEPYPALRALLTKV
jgi:hypothetical protein